MGSRGDRFFGALFETPYGPLAYAQYERELASSPEPVYGLGEADLVRMHNYFSALAGEERYTRNATGLMARGFRRHGGERGHRSVVRCGGKARPSRGIAVTGGVGAAFLGAGLYSLLAPSSGELALSTFEQEIAANHAIGPSLS